jgi:hypothetical protein
LTAVGGCWHSENAAFVGRYDWHIVWQLTACLPGKAGFAARRQEIPLPENNNHVGARKSLSAQQRISRLRLEPVTPIG